MSKQKKLDSAGKEAFVNAVLAMLDEGLSLRELNLRKVARRVGCAHTNAYNYFESFEDLLWWSLKGALERMVDAAGAGEGDLIGSYIDFAQKHPTWYRLIWLDPLSGFPPDQVAAYLPVPGQVLTQWIAKITGGSDSGAGDRIRILHGYLHGELAAITAGRVTGKPAELKDRVVSGARMLFKMLFNMDYTEGVKDK